MLNEMSPAALAAQLGQRLKQTRLNANLTQDEVARRAGLSRRAVLGAESGKVQLETFIGILEALHCTGQLNNFLPEPPLSPIQLAKLHGKSRQRASSAKAQSAENEKENPQC